VKDHREQHTGHKTRLYCCQDKQRKQKARPSKREGAKSRDTLGMHRFDCDSNLWVKCLTGTIDGEKQIVVSLRHRDSHVHYYDVALPSGAAGMIREGLEWSTPVAMVGKIQAVYPTVTAGQIHSAWTEMSKILWKRAEMQLPSAKILLEEFGDDVDFLNVQTEEGVEQLSPTLVCLSKLR
jgi:hypothetical protein